MEDSPRGEGIGLENRQGKGCRAGSNPASSATTVLDMPLTPYISFRQPGQRSGGAAVRDPAHSPCGCSLTAEQQPSKLYARVRLPLSAPEQVVSHLLFSPILYIVSGRPLRI